MKNLIKKVLTLSLAGLLTIGMVGCGAPAASKTETAPAADAAATSPYPLRGAQEGRAVLEAVRRPVAR